MRAKLCGRVILPKDTFSSTLFFTSSLTPYDPPIIKVMVLVCCISDSIFLANSSLLTSLPFMSRSMQCPLLLSIICLPSAESILSISEYLFASATSLILNLQNLCSLLRYSPSASSQNFSFRLPTQTMFIFITKLPI